MLYKALLKLSDNTKRNKGKTTLKNKRKNQKLSSRSVKVGGKRTKKNTRHTNTEKAYRQKQTKDRRHALRGYE